MARFAIQGEKSLRKCNTVFLIALYPTFHQRIPKKMFSSYVPWPNSSDGAGRMGIQEWFMRPKYHATCFAKNAQASLINLFIYRI